MLRFILKRLVGLAPVIVAAVVVTFAALRALPGDPVAVMLSDHSADAAMAARLRAEYGLDRSLPEQFLRYVGDILTGNFGLSFRYVHMPVSSVLKDSLLISPVLALAAMALALPLGALAGVQAAIPTASRTRRSSSRSSPVCRFRTSPSPPFSSICSASSSTSCRSPAGAH
jgi:peptide/nickel transport system permease protein